MTHIEQVKEFHETFDVPVLNAPQIPDRDRVELRIALIKEEFKEFQDAIDEGDIVGIADALCDLAYVVNGAAIEFGLTVKFEDLFAETHRSNMSKACKTYEEAMDSKEQYQKEGVEVFIDPKIVNDVQVWNLFRASDKKLMKSKQYSPVDLKSILEA